MSRKERRSENRKQLLEQVKPYCDEESGKVLQAVPEELMRQLRACHLAMGVELGSDGPTGHRATWFVFFSPHIQRKVEKAAITLKRQEPPQSEPA